MKLRELSARLTGKSDAEAGPAAALLRQVDQLQGEAGDNDAERQSELVELRHRAGAAMVGAPQAPRPYPEPAPGLPSPNGRRLPELSLQDVSGGLLRAAILRDGCAMVRELVPQEVARSMAEKVQQLFDDDPSQCYREFAPQPPYVLMERPWVRNSGGIWLADAPELMHELLGLYGELGLRDLISNYLGGRPVLSVNKSTLRRADAKTSAIDWHQDGAFMGEVRTLNVWLSLSDCGEEAPGLLVVPKRVARIVETGTPGARYDWSVSPTLAEVEAGADGPLHPSFRPGDAMLFDNFFLHATWVHNEMPSPRFALETWFFNPATFPTDYVPLAV